MKNISRRQSGFTLTVVAILLPLLGLMSCGFSSSGGQSSIIDWVNFVRFGGITYLVPSIASGRGLKDSDLGPVYATVSFKLDGNVHDPAYHAKDGDAAFLNAGTPVYTVKGYTPTFRLAARQNNVIQLYEADTNPQAKKGGDLLDIGGKVQFIGINSEQDGVTQLAAIKDPNQVASLVNMILEAPVDQSHPSQGNKRYFIAFHLIDGTMVIRAYLLDSNELSRGILPSKAFANALEQALGK